MHDREQQAARKCFDAKQESDDQRSQRRQVVSGRHGLRAENVGTVGHLRCMIASNRPRENVSTQNKRVMISGASADRLYPAGMAFVLKMSGRLGIFDA